MKIMWLNLSQLLKLHLYIINMIQRIIRMNILSMMADIGEAAGGQAHGSGHYLLVGVLGGVLAGGLIGAVRGIDIIGIEVAGIMEDRVEDQVTVQEDRATAQEDQVVVQEDPELVLVEDQELVAQELVQAQGQELVAQEFAQAVLEI
jgi:hypothetical protein